MQRVLVVGGSGFVGSAICRTAVARGWDVVSLSRSGSPFATAEGHSPAWVKNVDWRKGSPFDIDSFEELLTPCTAVVSTLGVLFESDYKSSGSASPLNVLKNIFQGAYPGHKNPLKSRSNSTYERMNRDSAILMMERFSSCKPLSSREASPFVFISAEDIFRPFVPAKYIISKREAEHMIMAHALDMNDLSGNTRSLKPVIIRPSLIYHPHVNPVTTLPATLLEASASLQAILPPRLRLNWMFPSEDGTTSKLSPATSSLASLLSIPPIHVDAVAEMVCRSIEDPSLSGVINVEMMRGMVGFA